MSLWIWKRDKTGRRYLIAVGLPISLIFSLVLLAVGMCICLLLVCVATAPVESMLSFLVVTGLGFFLFATAKASVFRQGCYVSFGSGKMGPRMRTAYRVGWVLMVIEASLTLFAISFASRIQSCM